MHASAFHQLAPTGSRRLWLIAGTGEGPRLAGALLAEGWELRVSVVTAEAAAVYGPQPRLELAVGAIGGDGGVAAILEQAAAQARPFRWVIDASHPFATQISASLARVCGAAGQPLLRLHRPDLTTAVGQPLPDLAALQGQCRRGERVLLAIGARHLAQALASLPGVVPHCRILPTPTALRQALAAGLAAERLACLRPAALTTADPAIERALCRQWRIETVICRDAGAAPQQHWQRICGELGLRLLLLQRPAQQDGVAELGFEDLLERLGRPQPR